MKNECSDTQGNTERRVQPASSEALSVKPMTVLTYSSTHSSSENQHKFSYPHCFHFGNSRDEQDKF